MKNDVAMKPNMWNRIVVELRPSHLFSREHFILSLVSGIIVGLMTAILSISFAVLVFGKALPEALSVGIGLALFSNVILHLFAALTSSQEGIIAHVQSLPPPIQAAMLSSLMAFLPLSIPVEQKTVVAVLVMLCSAIFTGGILFLLGALKWGRLVRFLPLPVISGFLASVGFALILGGIATMTQTQITLAALPDLFSLTLLSKWLMGFFLAAALWLMVPRLKHALVLPAILGIAVVLFYTLYFVNGFTIAELKNAQLLLGPFPQASLWQSPLVYYNQLHLLDWTYLTNQMGIIATLPLVCFIGGLLMLSAIEFSIGAEVEPNFELKTMGASNFISGILGGGFVGYPSTTFTVMQRSLGSKTRLAGILGALVSVAVLVFGAEVLGFIPRFIVGGILIYFGYQFIDHWVIKQFKHASVSNLSIMSAIVFTSLWLGFVPSVGVGILAAAGFFLFKYSQTSVIRYVATGASLRSRVTRNEMHDDWLATHAERISIFGLQGYIFFGTAHNLHEEMMTHVTEHQQNQQTPLDAVILDFRHVTGIDTSVVQSFHKLYQQLLQRKITLIFTQMPQKYQRLMRKTVFGEKTGNGFAMFETLDEALEWRENVLLQQSDLPPYTSRTLRMVLSEYFRDETKADILLQYLTRLELSAGTKIIQQDMAAYDLFFIESGRVSTFSEQEGRSPIRLQTMTDDTLVGEIGFYLGQTRTATVIADAPSIVYRLSTDSLAALETAHPIVAMALHRLIVEKTAKRINHVFKSVKGFM